MGAFGERSLVYKKCHLWKEETSQYEWVEDEINENESILADEVRYQAGVIIGEEFGTYKKFEKLAIRIRKFLNLKSVGEVGKAKKWI